MGNMKSEIVITGISGKFPDSDGLYQFRDNLFNKVDILSDDERRWAKFNPILPKKIGTLFGIDDFDYGFFGIPRNVANRMEPMTRLALERVHEALIDAGHHPYDFQGQKCGVYSATSLCENPATSVVNSIAYHFQLDGPSFVTDTACSSSLYAIEAAYTHIKNGLCDRAIICGLNTILDPFLTMEFMRLGVLSPDGVCKCFSDDADGYARSETVVAIILEKKSEAKRIYADVIHCKTNCDGYKEESITFPSSEVQQVLMKEFYEECKIDPTSVTYIEAHATGTRIGDPLELKGIDNIFCRNRSKPLLVGSVKSNMGHSEPAAGLCSVAKVIIGMETGFIAPNLHYTSMKKGVEALEKGRLQVVVEKTPWPEKKVLVGINGFGFGGANGHLLLYWNPKIKNVNEYKCDLPKIICVSGRTKQAVACIFEDIVNRDFDPEFGKLVQQAYRKPISGNIYHGYAIFKNSNDIDARIEKVEITKKRLCIILNDFPKENQIMIQESLEKIPKYAEIFKEIRTISKDKNYFLTQLAIVELLKFLNVTGNIKTIAWNKSMLLQDFANSIIPDHLNATFLIIGEDIKIIKNNNTKINLFNTSHSDVLTQFFDSLGELYLKGFCMELDRLYPEINYPVSRGTPMISPLIKWDRRRTCYSFKVMSGNIRLTYQENVQIVSKSPDWNFVTGHVIDGKTLFPGVGYLYLAWKTLSRMMAQTIQVTPVVFEDVKLVRASSVPTENTLTLTITVSQISKTFEIREGDNLLVTGKIYSFESNAEFKTEKRNKFDSEEDDIFLDQVDIYKELRLRGYNYCKEFKSIQSFGMKSNTAIIKWNDNWTTFLDCMCHSQLLVMDSKDLYIPTTISRLTIDPIIHEQAVSLHNNQIPVHIQSDLKTVSCAGIQLGFYTGKPIVKKKLPEPVLEAYKFIPYHGQLDEYNAVYCIIQTILENTNNLKIAIVEIVPHIDEFEPIMSLIQKTLDHVPLVQPEFKILNEETDLNISEIGIEAGFLNLLSNPFIVLIHNHEYLEKALSAVNNSSGYVILKDLKGTVIHMLPNVNILCSYQCENGTLYLVKQKSKYSRKISIDVSSIDDLSWIENVKSNIDNAVLLYSQNAYTNGLLGLVNCLRKESLVNNVSAVLIMGNAPQFDSEDSFYKSQLEKNLFCNVFKNGHWGSYKHLLLREIQNVQTEHSAVHFATRGDLSSLKWVQGPLTRKEIAEKNTELVNIHYSAINFKDVMTATAKITASSLTTDRRIQECIEGFEYSGCLVNDESKRVMGITSSRALSTMVIADKSFMWEIPEEWSYEDAATVPVVYATVLYAFFSRGNLKAGQSVLIHSGTGGVGQAALNIASHLGCVIFTTVGTQEKRDFIKKHFPKIKEEHIGDSRSTSFEQMVMVHTNGRGVDFVLNSLTGDKLEASVRCLAYSGVFFEIGKFDLIDDKQLSGMMLKKQCRYAGVMVDRFFGGSEATKLKLKNLVSDGIKNGFVKPLIRTVFPRENVEQAFRFMTIGKHIGKVLVQIRDDLHIKPLIVPALPRFWCDSRKVQVILGGLGGFGLELADWLMIRGAKKLILTSRSGIKNGYQAYRLKILKSYGVNVYIRNDNTSTQDGCDRLLKFGESLGGVEAIFNLAVVLKDALFENQTVETFKTSLIPKAYTTRWLDIISRNICPNLKHFVIFSSVTCGKGNIGQTNYGYANSVMERICEKRKMDGYPALAIQWGPIGDVGLVAEVLVTYKESAIAGTLQQGISNCLQVLDRFLTQDETIVSSVVVAVKGGASQSDNIVETVMKIIGVKDLKGIGYHTPLPELGMDSMMVVEIRQTLEREYDVFLTPQDLRNLTLAKLQEIMEPKKKPSTTEGQH